MPSAPALAARGFAVSYREAPLDDLAAPELFAADLLVVLGGPIGAYEEAAYPFLAAEIALIERRLRPGGRCSASASARSSWRGPWARASIPGAKEMGWAPLELSDAGRRSCLRALGGTAVLHWHGDTFDLPAGATHLAATERTANQAFQWQSHGLALQFHIETTARGLERWYVGHALEIATTAGASVAALREQSARHAPALAGPARAVLEDWLGGLEDRR